MLTRETKSGEDEGPPEEQGDNEVAENIPIQTPGLKEPKNNEVREMVLRQLKDARKVARYMYSTEDLVEEKIRKAMEKGEFNNLEGKGKPFKFEENPYEDPALRVPFKILKDAGFSPYWIELGKEIDAEIAGAHMIFEKFIDGLKWRKAKRGYLEWTPELEYRRDRVLESCARKFEAANKKIDFYNRIVPIYWIQRLKIDEEKELAALRKKWEEIVIIPNLKE
ncbi:MAG: DUF1992 domain-containing protein [Syntrophomonadaceae bacterium]|nr:DUF1992 domain-containing protein [Syntrophomonadaceae bacterium]